MHTPKTIVVYCADPVELGITAMIFEVRGYRPVRCSTIAGAVRAQRENAATCRFSVAVTDDQKSWKRLSRTSDYWLQITRVRSMQDVFREVDEVNVRRVRDSRMERMRKAIAGAKASRARRNAEAAAHE